MRPLYLLPVLLVAGLVLAGCGDGGGSDQEQVRASAQKMLDAAERQDPKDFCAQLDPRSQKNFGAIMGIAGQNQQLIAGCQEAARISLQASGDQKQEIAKRRQQIKSGEVTIKGDKATIKLGGEKESLILHRVDGRWLVEINS